MSRVVVVLQKTINGPSQVFLAEPSNRVDADTPAPIKPAKMTPVRTLLQSFNTVPMPANAIRDMGMALMDMLQDHPAILNDVLPLLDPQTQKEAPIYLWMKDPDLEQMPWEALHAPNVGFLSGNKLFPVARAQKVIDKKPESVFIPPLKLMAVLGASGDDALTHLPADDEWNSLYTAVKRSKLNINLRVLVCEEALKARIDAEKQDWITTGFLIDGEELFNDIRDFAPHMLHFFCHGIANPLPQLHIASRLNWEREEPGGIQLEGSQLRQRADPDENVWLITLNCCESAQKADGTGSRSMPMASSLVTAGFPAVVGMRERVEKQLAHAFCRQFYDALLTDLTERIQTATRDGVSEIHWACGLYAARQQICEALDGNAAFAVVAASAKEWTIPVLYTRLQAFRLRLMPDAKGAKAIFRPQPVAANGPPPQPPPNPAKPGLTQKEIRQLGEEMEQLAADRERFKNFAPVVRKIDARLAEIEAALNA